jgi:hypothetical protein
MDFIVILAKGLPMEAGQYPGVIALWLHDYLPLRIRLRDHLYLQFRQALCFVFDMVDFE